MGLNTGETVVEGDFINQAEKNATPSSDVDKTVKLESDGRFSPFFTRNGAVLTAGETINGATLPVPVYQNKTDNELYACDANDNTRYKFIGFATSNSTNGNPITFQGSGVVSGFTGLQEGEKYYVQDTVGTIGTTPGTVEILVGIAISETQLLIQRGRRFAHGIQDYADVGGAGATQDTVLTIGFRPTIIRIEYASSNGATAYFGSGTFYVPNSTYTAIRCQIDGSGAVVMENDDNGSGGIFSATWTFTFISIGDNGFTIRATQAGASPETVKTRWEAEGEL